eukprot:3066967-Amphidinium_carterae.1
MKLTNRGTSTSKDKHMCFAPCHAVGGLDVPADTCCSRISESIMPVTWKGTGSDVDQHRLQPVLLSASAGWQHLSSVGC